MEECLLPKQDVVGSNPITRSIKLAGISCIINDKCRAADHKEVMRHQDTEPVTHT